MPWAHRGTHSSGLGLAHGRLDDLGDVVGGHGLHPTSRGHAGGQLGLDDGGQHHADVDPVRLELGAGGLAEADDGELRRRVGGAVGHRDASDRRGHVDDVAAPALDHAGRDGLGAEDDAVQVDVDDPPGHLVGLLEHRPERHDAGVVDEDVDRSDRGDLLQERGPRGRVGDVERSGHDAVAELVGDGAGQVGVAVADRHAGALTGEPGGGGAADAAGTSGDDDGQAGDVASHAADPFDRGRRSTGRPSLGNGSEW